MDALLASATVPLAAAWLSAGSPLLCIIAAGSAAGSSWVASSAAGAPPTPRHFAVVPFALAAAALFSSTPAARPADALALLLLLALHSLAFTLSFALGAWCERRCAAWPALGISRAERSVLCQVLLVAVAHALLVLLLLPPLASLREGTAVDGRDARASRVVIAVLAAGSALAAAAAAAVLFRGAAALAVGAAIVLATLLLEYGVLFFVLPLEPLLWLLELTAANAAVFAWLAGGFTATLVGTAAWLARSSRTGASATRRGNSSSDRGRMLTTASPNNSPSRRQTTSESEPAAAPPTSYHLLLVRKAFHVAALLLFAPPILLLRHDDASGRAFLQIAALGALHLALLVELLRATAPAGTALRRALDAGVRPFVDERDSGPFILTHLYLIAGCCVPIILSPQLQGGGGSSMRLLPPLAGVLAAMGDAAAAAGGLAAAASAMPWLRRGVAGSREAAADSLAATLSRKTVQGTLSFFACAAAVSLAALWLGGGGSGAATELAAVAASAAIAAAVETLTSGVDNLLLPLVYWLALSTLLPLALPASSSPMLS